MKLAPDVAPPTLSVSSMSLSFQYVIGGAPPASQQVSVTEQRGCFQFHSVV